MDTNKYFNKLVNNMFENLTKSIDCIETDGKSSIIHYFSALELLFKARLFKEHWAFILQDIDSKKATINNLQNGDFLTISFDIAISRIQNLLQDLDDGYETYFEDLRKIRNRLIHFDCTDPKDKDFSIKNISKTWYYVYKLLNEKWKDIFAEHTSQIEEINNKMEKYSEHFWCSKRDALINRYEDKYKNDPKYKLIKIHNKPFICTYCNLSYETNQNLNLMQMSFDHKTFTLTKHCDLCEHEEYLFLFSLYLNKNKGINSIKSEFRKLIDENLWTRNQTVNCSHFDLLLNASVDDLGINFDEIYNWSYDDFELETHQTDKTTTNISLKFYRDFSIDSEFDCPAYYVLYTTLIFVVNMEENKIRTSNFSEIYDAIEDMQIEFFIDSDGF